ncbi:Vacuolar protein sorting-associated protein 9-like protein [Aduncisulcus paluster]|uniref:Vacuolar protein sorting-associated protein 9-like protein n=1 Tax=Aduncisulcus paluster TaxID=2918883 RepID=A0ABQ5KD25_9EUKA|nr:Vacuolar protein sorting-associated protein 9-like protein [Aduncisulcus paluster]|eukprot:gnl/Carplike_NY0171/5985_a8204_191.p1 GENE.gnl/Carplike_NY0171/5985_a8204_191~~gnl/Carplike_NY0171/5985_a8204_191.p1  ORF type:complete len:364 (-),score=63.94 gnl/Carplike_NY0171/5985_a8204_191:283-1374(-)
MGKHSIINGKILSEREIAAEQGIRVEPTVIHRRSVSSSSLTDPLTQSDDIESHSNPQSAKSSSSFYRGSDSSSYQYFPKTSDSKDLLIPKAISRPKTNREKGDMFGKALYLPQNAKCVFIVDSSLSMLDSVKETVKLEEKGPVIRGVVSSVSKNSDLSILDGGQRGAAIYLHRKIYRFAFKCNHESIIKDAKCLKFLREQRKIERYSGLSEIDSVFGWKKLHVPVNPSEHNPHHWQDSFDAIYNISEAHSPWEKLDHVMALGKALTLALGPLETGIIKVHKEGYDDDEDSDDEERAPPPGADSLIPSLIYCIGKSIPMDMAACVSYIMTYMEGERELRGAASYFLTCLDAAVSYYAHKGDESG